MEIYLHIALFTKILDGKLIWFQEYYKCTMMMKDTIPLLKKINAAKYIHLEYYYLGVFLDFFLKIKKKSKFLI